MVRVGLAALLVLSCASQPSLSPDAAATKDAAPTTSNVAMGTTDASVCPLPTNEENGPAVVESAEAQPPWVEIDVTLLFSDPSFDWMAYGASEGAARDQLMAQRVADLAPIGDDLASRLRAIGGRDVIQFWAAAAVAAVVPARHVSEIPCWPNVVDITPDGLGSDGDPLATSCFASPTCSSTSCTQLSGDDVDLAHGCARHDAPVACSPLSATDGAPLTCYVEIATDRIFSVTEPFLVEMGDTAVRKCTPTEGGTTAPAQLPECP
jgi:hypothetical protein